MSLTLAFALSFTPASPQPRDAWFGRDKAKHFVAAAAIQSVAYALLHRGSTSRASARWRATAVTTAASVGKEVFDRSRGRAFSGRDLAWDAGGAGMATVAIIYASRK